MSLVTLVPTLQNKSLTCDEFLFSVIYAAGGAANDFIMTPGWVYTGFEAMYSITPHNKEYSYCNTEHGFFYLLVRDNITISWISYTAGNPVPSKAKISICIVLPSRRNTIFKSP